MDNCRNLQYMANNDNNLSFSAFTQKVQYQIFNMLALFPILTI